MRLAGRVAVVTGASRGIGAATARALVDRGAAVGLVARSADDLETLSTGLGSRAASATADVTDRDALATAVGELEARLGPIDVLVNNAGIGAYRSVLEEEPTTFERLMRVNYLGTVHATRVVLPGMVARGRGHLVFVASVAGRLGAPFEAAYSASKFAVVGFAEALGAEVSRLGVDVSLVEPGPVASHFTEARGVPFQRVRPRPQRPERVAAAIADAVERDRFEQVLPQWLRVGVAVRALAPSLYRRGLRRDVADEATALAARVRGGRPR